MKLKVIKYFSSYITEFSVNDQYYELYTMIISIVQMRN